ncbi:Hypothetical predicted protein [Lecanosticta acicola]|uniref:SAP domain-containing protein n=1 Tax=Lecanosticta acicola TaxID=111012 RepID=A0AAI9EE80_9PEZI|nr:Hypothetical predicted protein [Lecanosticta acicola]
MAAPRATQFIALRNLARGSHQARQLHMTGPTTYASPIITKERPLQLPRDIAGLRAECKKRNLEIAGSKNDLLSRLEADVLAHNRAFTTAANRRPSPPSQSPSSSSPPTRDFNTSRTLKSTKDSSPIDFAYFPTLAPATPPDILLPMRVPILPTTTTTTTTTTSSVPADIIAEEETLIVKPQISTMSMDRVFLPATEMTDGDGAGIDFHALAARVGDGVKKMRVPVEEQAGLMRRIWSDMVDDVFAVKKDATTTTTA